MVFILKRYIKAIDLVTQVCYLIMGESTFSTGQYRLQTADFLFLELLLEALAMFHLIAFLR